MVEEVDAFFNEENSSEKPIQTSIIRNELPALFNSKQLLLTFFDYVYTFFYRTAKVPLFYKKNVALPL